MPVSILDILALAPPFTPADADLGPSYVNLYAGIAATAEADATLAALLPGGVFLGRGDLSTAAPYVSLQPIGGDEFRNHGDPFWVREVVRASIFAREFHEARRIAVRWGQVFHKGMEPFRMDDAEFGQIQTSTFRYVGEDDYQGRALHHGYVEMTCITTRVLA